jgi:hypothetical protein
MHWILILGIFTDTSSIRGSGARAATAISSIPGFVSEQECKDAGDAFRKSYGSEGSSDNAGRQAGLARYVCVRQTRAK